MQCIQWKYLCTEFTVYCRFSICSCSSFQYGCRTLLLWYKMIGLTGSNISRHVWMCYCIVSIVHIFSFVVTKLRKTWILVYFMYFVLMYERRQYRILSERICSRYEDWSEQEEIYFGENCSVCITYLLFDVGCDLTAM